ncbi:type II secretion system protein N [Aquisalimonas lutea]|uniref:type II secretion system protein N n=1 Tax=Aquisalimonas lutea TaxID=1327750 RepID=UPI0033906E87
MLVIALAHAAAQLTRRILPAPAPDAPPPARGRGLRGEHGASDTASEAIARWHLFGRAQAADGERDQRIDAPETRLDLQLNGVFYSPDPARSRAIISGSSRGTERNGVGNNT